MSVHRSTGYLHGAALDGSTHLIKLEESIKDKGSALHLAIIKALGEAGGADPIEHLIKLEEGIEDKGSALHLNIISALGQASRIS